MTNDKMTFYLKIGKSYTVETIFFQEFFPTFSIIPFFIII